MGPVTVLAFAAPVVVSLAVLIRLIQAAGAATADLESAHYLTLEQTHLMNTRQPPSAPLPDLMAAIQRLEGSRKKRLVNAADQARRELDASRTPQGSQHGGPRIVPAASQPSFSRPQPDSPAIPMHRQQQQQSRLQTSNSVTFSPSTLGSQDDTRQAKPSSHQLGFAGSSRQHVAPAQGYSTKQGDYSAGQRQMYGGSKYEVQRSSPSAPQLGKPSVLKQSGGQRWHTGSGRGSVLDTNSPDDEQGSYAWQ